MPIIYNKPVKKFQESGKLTTDETTQNEYVDNLTGIISQIESSKQYLTANDEDKTNTDRMINEAITEIPNSFDEIADPANRNEVNYLHNLSGRLKGYLTPKNLDTMSSSNSFKNIRKKYDLLKELPMTRSDADSITKYMPTMAYNYYLDRFKYVLPKDKK